MSLNFALVRGLLLRKRKQSVNYKKLVLLLWLFEETDEGQYPSACLPTGKQKAGGYLYASRKRNFKMQNTSKRNFCWKMRFTGDYR